ncbi:hypothetical protein SEVIR_5G177576v4 [Setaria viridis]
MPLHIQGLLVIEVEVEDLHEEDDLHEQPSRNNEYARDSYKVKAEIPKFHGSVDIEKFLDWLYEVETFFEIMNISQDSKVPLVSYKLNGGASTWLHHHQEERIMRGDSRVKCW